MRQPLRRPGRCFARPIARPLVDLWADRAITQLLALSCGPIPPSYMSQGKSARSSGLEVLDCARVDLELNKGVGPRAPFGPARPAARESLKDHGQVLRYRSRDHEFLRRGS